MNEEILKTRFKNWAIKGVLFTRQFPNEPDFKAIRNQMVRCIPSCAANYRAACRAKSNADFINKLKIVEEELDESMFWLEFVVGLDEKLRTDVVSIYKEADELLAITVASIKTLRNKQVSNRKS
ncbi:MAG: four helix bundle protein [Flectobacillus sp.]|jgi:four helix bundle protein|nr:four helix bundle protein [Flectobacillus sp.]